MKKAAVVSLTLPIASALALSVSLSTAGQAAADNNRLNESVVAGVHNAMMNAGCSDALDIEPMTRINPKLQLAAEWQARDLMANRALDGGIGTDGSTVADRAARAGYVGPVAETVAINPALAISGVEIMQQWNTRPDDKATIENCANFDIGVWSENSMDRTVVVAVYGRGDAAPPVPAGGRQFGSPSWVG